MPYQLFIYILLHVKCIDVESEPNATSYTLNAPHRYFEIFTNFISRENHTNHCEYQERFVRKYNETSLTLKPLQFLIKSTTPCHKYDVTAHLKFPAMDKHLSTTFVFQRTSVSGKTVKLSLHMHLTMFE